MAIELFDTFDRARDEASFIEQRQAQLVHNSAQADGAGELNNAGVMDGATGAARDTRLAEKKAQKRQKDSVDTQMLLAALDKEIAATDVQIDIGTSFAEDLASGKVPDLNDDGSLKNQDREEFLKKYEERTGVKVDRTDVDSMKKAVDAQNDYLGKHRQSLAIQREGIDRSKPVNAAYEETLSVNSVEDFREQNTLQASGLATNTYETQKAAKITDFPVDEEIERFMQEFAKAQEFENNSEQLIAEQELLQGLSEEAREIIEYGEDTEHLFADNYFDGLSESTVIPQDAQTEISSAPTILPI